MSNRRRFALALAAALGLHVLAFALLPHGASPPADAVRARVVSVSLSGRPSPTPLPRPSPAPPPPRPTPPPHATLAPRVVTQGVAANRAAKRPRRSGGAAGPRLLAVAPRAPQSRRADDPARDTGPGGGTAAGPGAGADAGSGEPGGAGPGSGMEPGNGTADAATSPCADIFLLPGDLSYRKDGTVVQQVLAKIVERDGTVEVDRFPYPFTYSAEKLNPFRHDDAVASPNGGIPVQQPPPGMDVTAMPASVRTILKYTDPETGYTSLPACRNS